MNEPRRWLDPESSAPPEVVRALKAARKPAPMTREQLACSMARIELLEPRSSLLSRASSFFRATRGAGLALAVAIIAALIVEAAPLPSKSPVSIYPVREECVSRTPTAARTGRPVDGNTAQPAVIAPDASSPMEPPAPALEDMIPDTITSPSSAFYPRPMVKRPPAALPPSPSSAESAGARPGRPRGKRY